MTSRETSSGEQAGVKTARLLVLDDDEVSCRIVGEVGKKAGFEVELAFDGSQFRSTFASFAPTAIVLDLVLPETDGVEILRFLADEGFGGRLILVSGMEARVLATTRRLAISRGLSMAAVHQKPVEPFELESSLRTCLPGADTIGEEELLLALERDELVLEYQPQVRWTGDSSRIEATEALVRWNKPGYGLVAPAKLLAMMEKLNLTDELIFHILDKTFEQLRAWHDDGLCLKMAINLQPQLLEDLTLPDRIAKLLEKYSLEPSHVVVEITESAAMADPERSMDILTRFRLKGMALSIDDFGTGYSSMVQLYHLPFNELKIDRSLISEVPEDSSAKTIVETIVRLAHSLGMSVCAEGAERKQTLDYVRSLGCDSVQGYVISDALPGDAVPSFVRDWNELSRPRAKVERPRLDTRNRRPTGSEPRPEDASVKAGKAAQAGSPPLLDRARIDALRSLSGEDGPDFLAQLFEIHDNGTGGLMQELRVAVESADLRTVELLAHHMKGRCLSLGAPSVGAICEGLEATARAGGSEDLLAPLRSLEEELEKTRLALAAEIRTQQQEGRRGEPDL